MPGFAVDEEEIYLDRPMIVPKLTVGNPVGAVQVAKLTAFDPAGSWLAHMGVQNLNATPQILLDNLWPVPQLCATVLYTGKIDGTLAGGLSSGFGGMAVVTTTATTDFSYGGHTWRLTMSVAAHTLTVHRTAGSFSTAFGFLILFF